MATSRRVVPVDPGVIYVVQRYLTRFPGLGQQRLFMATYSRARLQNRNGAIPRAAQGPHYELARIGPGIVCLIKQHVTNSNSP
eukprot:10253237-Heterocapsa_arctica.AAC.1